MNGWEKLIGLFPWPAVRPSTHPLVHGWTTEEQQWEVLMARLQSDSIVVEVGAWTGKTSLYLLGLWPRMRLIAVDVWTENVSQLSGHWPAWKSEGKLTDKDTPKSLYLANLWEYRERVIAIQADSVAGMIVVNSCGIAPDLVYIDADHGEKAVYRDVSTAAMLFPGSLICGHDYLTSTGSDDHGVARSVKRCAIEYHKNVQHQGKVWWYE